MKLALVTRRWSLVTLFMLSACGGSLPPPDWKLNAQGALEAYTKHYLEGDSRLAELNFDKARSAIARTGRLDLMARAELVRCASHAAALDFDACPGFMTLSADAAPAETAYFAFLTKDWQELDAHALPAQYELLVAAKDEATRAEALAKIADPQARLLGAAMLFRQGWLNPAGIALAVETASERGWRRPLLAWLRVQVRRAESAGDKVALEQLRKRIDLVMASKPVLQDK
jgi:hypothetical protein